MMNNIMVAEGRVRAKEKQFLEVNSQGPQLVLSTTLDFVVCLHTF